jgi:hypothetical protein
MTTENLLELFRKGIDSGRYFTANTRPIGGSYMEFSYLLYESGSREARHADSLGKMSISCEFDATDYYEGWTESFPFGIRYFIKYDPSTEGIKALKLEIKPEVFSKLLTAYRVKERESAATKQSENVASLGRKMEKIESSYKIEVSSLKRTILCEKTKA